MFFQFTFSSNSTADSLSKNRKRLSIIKYIQTPTDQQTKNRKPEINPHPNEEGEKKNNILLDTSSTVDQYIWRGFWVEVKLLFVYLSCCKLF
ncbi:hypothetical protein RHMOL_Rhmol07G0175200 [Rhododendron molle]|uniref:Uncharacterized protein n=1 Tax=Rhododendron molle TaxID=49168 RepID=A0ACC0N1Q4_RHOML|nr:hypothetical protein RHMOL_Rhmol07G0175200 [Rhododendron molle]